MSQSTTGPRPLPPSPRTWSDGSRRLAWKRPFDLLAGGLFLTLFLPLLAVIALILKASGPGPVFFRQERVGKLGVPFRIWKFRTMVDGAGDETHRRAAAAWFQGDPAFARSFKDPHDARVTRIGRVLRATDLDELPQLFNVVAGEMSLVGPRPAIPYELALYRPSYFQRTGVRPGMTGLWQITDRDRVSAAAMMAFDLRYVDDASLALDLTILCRTFLVALRRLLRRPARGGQPA